MPNYTEYTEQEIVEALEDCGFKRVGVHGTRETVMERKVEGHDDRRLRVYTSAVKGQQARGKGKDAARVIVVQRDTSRIGVVWKLAWTARRVHRTEKFLKNLQQRCRDAWKVANLDCPTCGALMVPRRKKGTKKDTFYGCTRFPECRATKPM